MKMADFEFILFNETFLFTLFYRYKLPCNTLFCAMVSKLSTCHTLNNTLYH
ncbi:hypothetical protein HanIR_Chr04g0165211 [Helianthus annuus]|nr:hypothetical protein HanIR_Chr04g0165211 [Helianthus annuus]